MWLADEIVRPKKHYFLVFDSRTIHVRTLATNHGADLFTFSYSHRDGGPHLPSIYLPLSYAVPVFPILNRRLRLILSPAHISQPTSHISSHTTRPYSWLSPPQRCRPTTINLSRTRVRKCPRTIACPTNAPVMKNAPSHTLVKMATCSSSNVRGYRLTNIRMSLRNMGWIFSGPACMVVWGVDVNSRPREKPKITLNGDAIMLGGIWDQFRRRRSWVLKIPRKRASSWADISSLTVTLFKYN